MAKTIILHILLFQARFRNGLIVKLAVILRRSKLSRLLLEKVAMATSLDGLPRGWDNFMQGKSINGY